MQTTPENNRKVTITINDDRVRIHAGTHAVAELKQKVDPVVPPDDVLWMDIDGGEDIALPSDGTIEVTDGLILYSQGSDGSHRRRVPIVIDTTPVVSPSLSVTGSILRNMVTPPIPADRDLFRDIDGSPDERIDDDEVVTLAKGAEFYSVPRLITPGSGA